MNSNFDSRFDELELLSLKPNEKQIIAATSKIGLSISQISRKTGISHSSLQYTVKRLHEKSLLQAVKVGKRKFWRSNIAKIVGHITYLQNLKNGTRD